MNLTLILITNGVNMKVKPRNFIAKYDYLVNTAKTFKDRKKEFKKGKKKYKQNYKMDSYESILLTV